MNNADQILAALGISPPKKPLLGRLHDAPKPRGNEAYWRAKLAGQGQMRAYKPTAGEKVERGLGSVLGKVVGEKAAKRLAGRAMAPLNDLTPVGNATGAADGGREFARGITRGNLAQAALGAGAFALSVIPGSSAAKRVTGNVFGKLLRDEVGAIRAYHASPYDFDKFKYTPDTRGTGDGTQVFGDGLYLAENQATSEAYLRQFTQGGKSGRLYEVNIDAEPDDLLDWDAPINSDSPQRIRDAMNKIAKDNPALKEKLWASVGQPGSVFYTQLSDAAKTGDLVKNQAYATELMRQAGVPGIKYLDQGSRGAGNGTRNYVVFDDQLLSIVNKR